MSAYLFHSDAIAEILRHRPRPAYIEWLRDLPREEQFTSAVSVADLFRGADASRAPRRHTRNIDGRVLPAVTVLPFDTAVARVFSFLKTFAGEVADLPDGDLQVAATALHHGLVLVTSSTGRFRVVPGLVVRPLPRASGSARDRGS